MWVYYNTVKSQQENKTGALFHLHVNGVCSTFASLDQKNTSWYVRSSNPLKHSHSSQLDTEHIVEAVELL